jgi:hypothetical protein
MRFGSSAICLHRLLVGHVTLHWWDDRVPAARPGAGAKGRLAPFQRCAAVSVPIMPRPF